MKAITMALILAVASSASATNDKWKTQHNQCDPEEVGLHGITRSCNGFTCSSSAFGTYRHEMDMRCLLSDGEAGSLTIEFTDIKDPERKIDRFYTTTPYELGSQFHGNGRGVVRCISTNSHLLKYNAWGEPLAMDDLLPTKSLPWGERWFECRFISQRPFRVAIVNDQERGDVLRYIQIEYTIGKAILSD